MEKFDTLIEQYLSGELQGAERRQFEERLQEDEALQKQMALYETVEGTLQEHFRGLEEKQDLLGQLQSISGEFFQEEKKSEPKGRIVTLRRTIALAIAAAAVAPGDSIYQLKGDFFKINEVLGNLVNTVQDELSVIWPMMRWIDRIGKRMDESLAIFSMDVARDAAWQLACELAALPDQAARDAAIAAKDVRVTAFGGKLINPGFLLNVVRVVVRLTERGNVPHKISTLNA